MFFWRLQNAAQRGGDLAWGKRPGRHLVEERLKQMKIAAIDQGHVHGSAFEFLRGIQAGESTAQNQDAMPCSLPASSAIVSAPRRVVAAT